MTHTISLEAHYWFDIIVLAMSGILFPTLIATLPWSEKDITLLRDGVGHLRAAAGRVLRK